LNIKAKEGISSPVKNGLLFFN